MLLGSQAYPKFSTDRVHKYFGIREFDCPCEYESCVFTFLNMILVNRLVEMRKHIGRPISINSGYRCFKHQSDLVLTFNNVKISQHLYGHAADLRVEGLSGVELEKIARLYKFRAVGVGKHFIHVDLRNDKERRWTYEY